MKHKPTPTFTQTGGLATVKSVLADIMATELRVRTRKTSSGSLAALVFIFASPERFLVYVGNEGTYFSFIEDAVAFFNEA